MVRGALEGGNLELGAGRSGSLHPARHPAAGALARCAVFAAAWLLSGCVVGPRYVSPTPAVPSAWRALPADVKSRAAGDAAWWGQFEDRALSGLVLRAIDRNLDLREAAGRVAEARALYRATASARSPAVEADAEVSRSRASENGLLPGGEAETLHAAGVSASWEVDLFGGVRRSVEAAGAGVQLSEEDRRAVLVAVCSDVARSYVNVRTLQRRLRVARANLESQGQIVELTRIRREGGIASSLDVAQAESVYANTQTTLPPLEALLEQELNRLGVLLAEGPGSLRLELGTEGPIPALPPSLAVELPAELIRRRPDIRRAERDLAAQTALIGVAEADLYPRLTLLGTFGFEATGAAELVTGSSRFYSFGPAVRWNLFAAGRIRALVKAQEARTEQALARYERAVLQGLEEVEGALISLDRVRAERRAVAEAVRAAERSLDLSMARYKDGLADFQNVLDAQRTLLQFEDALARAEGALAQSLIQLQRALGGGWEVLEGPPPPPAGREGGGEER